MNPAWSHRGGKEPRWPSLAASAALHVLVVAAIVILGRPVLKMAGASVPINIVATGPVTDTRAAEQAPQTQTAATENPVPQAPPAPPPPAPSVPSPPQPTPAKAVAKPVPVKPSPAREVAQPTFNFNKLQDSISRSVAASKAAKASSAPRGPSRAETAPQARPAIGQGITASDVEGLGQLLNRLWNPNCNAEPVDVDLAIDVDPNGRIRVDSGGRDHSPDAAVAASVIRAISAVHKVEPYDPKFRGQHFPIRFIASKACANR
ncbi:MAG TPA: hypothetical protein VF459_13100 [Caulobacteraceae bacterium]